MILVSCETSNICRQVVAKLNASKTLDHEAKSCNYRQTAFSMFPGISLCFEFAQKPIWFLVYHIIYATVRSNPPNTFEKFNSYYSYNVLCQNSQYVVMDIKS